MSVKRTYYCDGPHNPDIPDGDEKAERCPSSWPGEAPGPLKITSADWGTLHFCCWDCVLRYGAKIEPVEYIT